MLTFGIDWDDVIAPFNDRAIEMANEEYGFGEPLTLEDITSWENTGRAAVIKKYYHDPALYDRQYVPEESRQFIKKLQTKGIVYIITAAYPQFLTRRVEQIKEAFPDFPEEQIILGSQKSMVHVDITLDDGPKNILKSNSRFPVLMRKPWNRDITGVLAVNNFEEFFQLLEQIKSSMIEDRVQVVSPAVVALVGPSGSNKNKITRLLCRDPRFALPRAYTTRASTDGFHVQISEEEFVRERSSFLETTRYAGYAYGTKEKDISVLMEAGKFAVMPLDMCGAIAMKRRFPTVIIFCKCSREKMISAILEKEMSNHEKTLRLMSLENELKNAALCDFVVNTGKEGALAQILEICSG